MIFNMARRYIHGKRKRRAPLRQIEGFGQVASKDKKTTLSTVSSAGIKDEYGQKKLTGFGALVGEHEIGGGKLGLNISKVLEFNPTSKETSNITSIGAGYKTKKGFSLGISGEKGSFKGPHHDITTSWKPKLNIKKTTKKGNVYSLKMGKDSGMIGITRKF